MSKHARMVRKRSHKNASKGPREVTLSPERDLQPLAPGALARIGRVKHAPVTHAELEQTRKGSCQHLGLELIRMLGEPLDFLGNASGGYRIKAGEILKRLRSEFDMIAQESCSLLWASSKEIRSEEARDDCNRVWISSVSSKSLSGSAIRTRSCSCTTLLINSLNSSTVRSATFMMLPRFLTVRACLGASGDDGGPAHAGVLDGKLTGISTTP
jgi:hypothetical protein